MSFSDRKNRGLLSVSLFFLSGKNHANVTLYLKASSHATFFCVLTNHCCIIVLKLIPDGGFLSETFL